MHLDESWAVRLVLCKRPLHLGAEGPSLAVREASRTDRQSRITFPISIGSHFLADPIASLHRQMASEDCYKAIHTYRTSTAVIKSIKVLPAGSQARFDYADASRSDRSRARSTGASRG